LIKRGKSFAKECWFCANGMAGRWCWCLRGHLVCEKGDSEKVVRLTFAEGQSSLREELFGIFGIPRTVRIYPPQEKVPGVLFGKKGAGLCRKRID